MIMIINYLGMALAILLIFRAIPFFLRKFNISDESRRIINMASPILELVLWVLLAFKVITHYFSEESYFSLIMAGFIIVSLIILSLFILKDFVAGLILKSEYGLTKGLSISTKDFSGKIQRSSLLNAEILTDDQEIIKVPYSKISGEIIKIPVKGDLLRKYEFVLRFPAKKSIDETKKIAFKRLISKPWIIPSKKPELLYKKTESGFHVFKVYLFCLNEEHARLAIEGIE
jgi:small-conductance mechanosensitive channel